MKRITFTLVVPLLALQACTAEDPQQILSEGSSYSGVVQEDALNKLSNVSLQGVVRKLEGALDSYILETPGGSSITLVNTTGIDYSMYEWRQVEVSGALEESFDGKVRLLTVREITQLPSDENVSSQSDILDPLVSSASSTMSSVSSSAASEETVVLVTSSKASSVAASSVAPSTSGGSSSALSEEMKARIQKMARVRGPETWTQQYCSSHIGVCFPVRSDYWYRSFGASTDTLWHVELNSEDILNLGDGPLSVDLVSSSVAPSVSDGAIVEQGDTVIGYRLWTNNRVFRVRAPAMLRSAVETITKGIAPYTAP